MSIYLSDILESFYCLTSKDDTVKIEKNQSQSQGGILRTLSLEPSYFKRVGSENDVYYLLKIFPCF